MVCFAAAAPNQRRLVWADFTGQAGQLVAFLQSFHQMAITGWSMSECSIDVTQNSIDYEIKRLKNYKKFILSGTTLFAADRPFTNMSSSSNVGKPTTAD